MCRHIVSFALVAIVGILDNVHIALLLKASPPVDQSAHEISTDNGPNEQYYEEAETKQDLLEYEEPGQDENPLEFVMNLLYQIFGVTFKNVIVKLLRGVAAVLALLIVGLSAVSYSM